MCLGLRALNLDKRRMPSHFSDLSPFAKADRYVMKSTIKKEDIMTQDNPKTAFYDRIKADIDVAFRARDTVRADLLKTLISDATTAARKKENRLPFDSEIVILARKYIENARIMIDAYKKADIEKSREKIEKSSTEIEILQEYLPAEVSTEDVRAFVSELKSAGTLPAGPAALGSVMKALKDKYGNAFDGKVMTPIAKEILSA